MDTRSYPRTGYGQLGTYLADLPAPAARPVLVPQVAKVPADPDLANIAWRAWASAEYRKLPVRARLELLLHHPGLDQRPVYARTARQALALFDEAQQLKALAGLEAECARLRQVRRATLSLLPTLARLLRR